MKTEKQVSKDIISLTASYPNILELVAAHKTIFVAYSGGMDSHVLLHLLHNLCRDQPQVKLIAIHVNHNISPHAKEWARHCQRVCSTLNIKCLTRMITTKALVRTKANGFSPEAQLRQLRYAILAKALPQDACLVTAHHADDQAETLLLQLVRGAGPKGLAAMPEKIKFAAGWLARPLLGCSRQELLLYARQHQLIWIEDESNLEPKFDRNFIRHQVLPVIKKRWPAVVATLNRAAKHCAEASQLLETLAAQDLQESINPHDATILDINLLNKLPPPRQKNVLRFWLHTLGLPMPSEVKLMEVLRTVVNSRYDAMPVVKWSGAEVRRFRHGLYAIPPLAPLNKKKIKIPDTFKLDPKKIKIGFRQGGERVKLPGRQGTHTLSKLMQEWGIPPWLRDRVPLIYYEGNIIAVLGYYNALDSME